MGPIYLFAQDWESISTPVNDNLIIYDITFPPGQNDAGYVGCSNVTYNGKGTIMKTQDKGSSWQIIYQSNQNETGVSAIHFFDTQNGLAGTQGGNVMKTSDGGINWTSFDIDPTTNQGEISSLQFYDNDNGIALSQWGGVYRTTDGGTTWSSAATNIPGIAYQVAYADSLNLFAVGNQQTIFKSADGGNNWSNNFSGPNGWMINLGIHFADASNGLVTSEDGSLFVTNDGGETWLPYTITGQSGLMRGTLVVDENTMYICATPGAVYKSTDGGQNWLLDSPVDFNPSYYEITMTDDGSFFVCGSGGTGGTILRKIAVQPLESNHDLGHPLCNGDASGSISLNITGGDSPYSYSWSNGQTTAEITNITAGTYSCTITDNAGNTLEEAFTLTEPEVIFITSTVTDETIDGLADGTVEISVSGGTAPYTFLWNNAATTENIDNLEDGEYCVTITDSNNCELTACATVMAGVVSVNNIPALTDFSLFPNPVTKDGNVFIKLSFSTITDIALEIVDVNGKVLKTLNRTKVSSMETSFDLSGYPAGTYLIKVIAEEDGSFVSRKVLKVN